VAFLDSDDTWLPGKLAAQLHEIDSSGATACSTNAYRYPPGATEPAGLLHAHLPSSVTVADQLLANRVVTSSMLVSTAAVRRAGGFPETSPLTCYEDYALWLRIAQERPIRVLPEPWVGYRDDAASSIRGRMGLELRCTVNALRDFRRWRGAQRPRVATTWAERERVVRQLSGLVSVRDMVSRVSRPRPERAPSV
jgi:hypothetical protein